VAIGNRCPHRFAPLHKGWLEGGTVRCGYHGLGFDRTGRCVLNPHGSAGATSALSVPTYRLLERGPLLWIWMGAPDAADQTMVPDYESLDLGRFFMGEGYLHGNANYELMSDNILDLSHIEFLHPALGTDAVSRAKVEVFTDGDRVVTTRRMIDEVLPPGLAHVYQTGDARVNRAMQVTWQAPANMLLTVTVEPADGTATWLRGSSTLHLFTPETQHSTHYFYVGSMLRETATQELTTAFLDALGRAFASEDKVMIDAQQAMVGDADIMDLRPGLLSIDKAAVLARRTLDRMISAQPRE
jgi:vanillate O-demethylase monooxygenase subunit